MNFHPKTHKKNNKQKKPINTCVSRYLSRLNDQHRYTDTCTSPYLHNLHVQIGATYWRNISRRKQFQPNSPVKRLKLYIYTIKTLSTPLPNDIIIVHVTHLFSCFLSIDCTLPNDKIAVT